MKAQAWRDLAYLLHQAGPEEWAAVVDTIRVARGTALLASALGPGRPVITAGATGARFWYFVGVQTTPRIL